MNRKAKRSSSPVRLARGGARPNERLRDIGLGVTCGIAAVGIAAGVWIGGLRNHGNAEGAQPFTGATSLRDQPSSKKIAINVATFGSLRSIIGGASVQIAVPEGSTVADLSEHLADIYPALAPAAMLAVSDESEMLPLDQVLTEGQTVTLIGSMAGG